MVNMINKKSNIFGDDIAFVEQWDFSKANMSEENRINAITQVASICYQSSKSLNSESLYNRLLAESQGLPSSSFEFVPVLLSFNDRIKIFSIWDETKDSRHELLHTRKYGESILDGSYLLTNLRALTADVGDRAKEFFNTEEECAIIAQYFKVFLYKVDFPTRSQMVRHRVNWQELSRRYVSGKRVPFDFYVSEKMNYIESIYEFHDKYGDNEVLLGTEDILNICLEHYYKALEKGVKPQEARRIIPQAAYTQIWGAFQPTQYANFMKLRDDSHAQWEIAQVAKAMRELVQGKTV
ncbi:FAD-dependent thymidylate synthase [Aliarcobacter butzleri]|uniref:FAD-dependent thymidylate synthase n=1 Tax=Aliarcobacter butzleri TaxID=28197 RepID=A0AAW6VQG7_9BACT|nr:FAD-dependent thymidylate synthase [Aliarcobacter butzleri]MDK2062770.1 FAD-dependent thymidylate synthase [Aliarcobacter butzleri]